MFRKKIILVLLVTFSLNLLVVPVVMAAEEQEDFFVLDEIVVVASKYPEKLSEAPVSVEVITEEDLKEKNVQNVADLLRNLAGIYINDNGGLAGLKTISIRGSEPSQVLILVDGQPMNSRQNGQVDLSQLTTEQIERIEVLKGPASALYGANALGGVVNIITKGASEVPEAEFNLAYGSFNTKKYSYIIRNRVDNVGINLSLIKKSSDGYRENSYLEQVNFFTKFDVKLNKHSNLLFTFQHNDSDKGVPGSTAYPSPNAEQDDTDTNLNLQWKQKKEKYDLNLAIYHNVHEQVYDNPDEWGYTGPSEHDTKRTGIDFNRTDYFNSHTLTYGLEFTKNKIDSTENGQHDTLNKAIFIQDKWTVMEPLELTIGARFDDHELFGSEVSPRFGAVYSFNNNLNVHASVGKAYRTPTFNDLYWPATMFAEGNPDLEPEIAIAYETGIRYLDKGLKAELDYFNRDVKDLINWAAGNDGIWRPYNINQAQTEGIDLNITREVTEALTLSLNYTYLDSRDKETDDIIAASHNTNLGLTYNKDGISASLIGHMIDGRPDDLESYSVVNAKISKNFIVKNEEIEVAFAVNNLLDAEYEVNKGYPMPGRNYMLEISIGF